MDCVICDEYIKRSLDNGLTVEEVKLFGRANDFEAQEELNRLIEEDWDEDLTLSSWKAYVDQYRRVNPIPIEIGSATLGDIIQDVSIEQLLKNQNGAWNALKRTFGQNGLSVKSVREIETSALSVLSRISPDTRGREPVKGLVFGSVQSGKTANMEALISMAADTYWNIFIILSGTIENLRVQTRDRFVRDLKNTTAIAWRHIDLSGEDRKYSTSEMKLNVKGDFTHGTRYVVTCLKQKSRLQKLINWLYSDKDKARRMRVIVIDDEADQASINTAPILDGEDAEEYEQSRREINRLIVCLANGLLPSGMKPEVELQAMNYVSYTATPYANVLNEPPGESLYPKDFVHSLSAPDEYFGVNVIFGNTDYVDEDGKSLAPGLDVVRRVSDSDANDIKSAHKEQYGHTPLSMKKALCWFLCSAAVLRMRGHRKSISMLVHTSNKGTDHNVDYQLVHEFLTLTTEQEVLGLCSLVYREESMRFTYGDLARDFSAYGLLDWMEKSLPSFEEIEGEISGLIGEVGNITFAGGETLRYANGINICIDNCYSDRESPENVKMRLVYPSENQLREMRKAPVFIVIGGNTLARGLTIEGLACSYFTRNTNQADTLMQMARWFGYRKGYELLQRVWLTDEIERKYRALAKVEANLKEEIKRFEECGLRPDRLGVKVLAIPEVAKFMLSAKNKMQSAVACDYNFAGYGCEVTEFDSSILPLQRNIELTEKFLGKIDAKVKHTESNGATIWRGVSTEEIKEYACSYEISKHSELTQDDLRRIFSWIDGAGSSKLGAWNVAVAGRHDSPSGTWTCAGAANLPRVERSRKVREESHIDIGSLRSGADALCDVDESSLTSGQLEILRQGGRNIDSIRKRALLNLDSTPLLLIYRIDSRSTRASKYRAPIGTECDIISFSIIIPGEGNGGKAESYSIKLDRR